MKKLIIPFLFLFSSNAFAWSECQKTPTKVWLQFGNNTVWVCFVEPGCIFRTIGNATQSELNSMYAAALTAISIGKKFQIRYPENNVDCSSSTARADMLGYYFL